LSVIINWYEWLAMLPFVPFILVWLAAYLVAGSSKTAVRAAMDVTFLFLVGSVARLLQELTGSSRWGWLILFMLLLSGGWIGRRQELSEGGFRFSRLYKWLSRTGFTVLAFLYLILLIATLFV
jgi:hypothetical protein